MLTPVDDGPAVVACNSCRFSTGAQCDAQGIRGGARLIEALQAVKTGDPIFADIAVQETPCLFACENFCVVHLRAPGKIGYVLGRLTPSIDAARSVLEYAAAYGASDIGEVPYRLWPDGIKGHFLVRIPPPGFVAG